ncbi:FMN-binding protein [Jejudonia soesokkakensis]|uniref:FMN-binding protein n=1 Tax=Jejudonia soesokkakensis TaxID=1323432 RepID=A0ABW2MQ05_9FLAO
MIKKLFFLFGICFSLVSFSIPEKIEKKADKVISKFLDTENFQKKTITISEALDKKTASEFTNGNLFSISSKGSIVGYGYIGNAPSKTATFDYLVLFDPNFIITKSKVLIYREEYGGEIGSKRWLQQFDGESSKSSELKYNQDIIPISGATISVRSMTKAMNNLLQSIAVLQKEKAL